VDLNVDVDVDVDVDLDVVLDAVVVAVVHLDALVHVRRADPHPCPLPLRGRG
jgi:hypothetical protein